MSILNIHLVASVVLVLFGIECGPIEVSTDVGDTRKCKDLSEAINYLHASLPDYLTSDRKCKRYAILLSMARKKGLPTQLAVLQLSELQEDILNLLYEGLSAEERGGLYMSVIDIYRSTELAPPFIDLVDCLSQIDTASIRAYLNDRELTTLVRLYRTALGPPATKVDLESVDLIGRFPPAFLINLGKLFKGHFERVERDPNQIIKKFKDVEAFKGLKTSRMPHQEIILQLLDQRERRRQSRIARQKQFRAKNLARIREKDRIRKQRLRERKEKYQVQHGDRTGMTATGSVEPAPEAATAKASSSFIRPVLNEQEMRHRKQEMARARQRRYHERHFGRIRKEERARRGRHKSPPIEQQPPWLASQHDNPPGTATVEPGSPISAFILDSFWQETGSPYNGGHDAVALQQASTSELTTPLEAHRLQARQTQFGGQTQVEPQPLVRSMRSFPQFSQQDSKLAASPSFPQTPPETSSFNRPDVHRQMLDDPSLPSQEYQYILDSEAKGEQTRFDITLPSVSTPHPVTNRAEFDSFDDLLDCSDLFDDPTLQALLDDL